MSGRGANVDPGPVLAIAGGLLLLVSLFFDWYEPGISAWTAFEVIDLLLALSALGAIVFAVELMRPDLLPLVRVPAAERALVTAGTVTLVLVVSQLLNHPPAAQGAGVKLGAWLGLGGSALMFAGGIATIALVSLRVTVDRRAHLPPPPSPPPATRDDTTETRDLS
ncbi:MAG: hypothetical protein ACJ77M_12675 [Thermoleophilaceae bacterium]